MSIFSASGTATPTKNVNASTGSPLIQQLLTQIQNQQMQNQQPTQPQIFQPQPKAQLGLPLVLQQLYGPEAGAMIQQPVDPAPQGGFTTSPGFRPAIGVPQGGINNIAFAPGYGSSILNPGIRTADFRDRDGDGIDDRDQIGPGQPKFRFADFSLGDAGTSTATLPTLAELAAFNPIANSYALAGFTVGEIAAMPEFEGYGQTTGTGGSATSAGLANLEAQLREMGSKGPEDRPAGFGPKTGFKPTTMEFVDGKLVYKDVNPFLKTGVVPGDEVPTLPSFFSALAAFNPFGKKKKTEEEIAAEIAAANAAAVKEVEMAKARQARIDASTEASRQKAFDDAKKALADRVANYNAKNTTTKMTPTGDVYSVGPVKQTKDKSKDKDVGRKASKADRDTAAKGKTGGGFCFDPDTLVKMDDGTEKKIKDIKLGDQTKGGEVTGVFQFKAADEIHDYKGVTVAGSHYVKEDGKFIMVQDSPISVKIDKIPVVHSLDTTGRRIFIKDIEFADYNGDGIAKGFLANAGVDLTGFDKEVLRQVENRLI